MNIRIGRKTTLCLLSTLLFVAAGYCKDDPAKKIEIDAEQVKQTVDQSVDQIAASLQDAIRSLETELQHLGNNKSAVSDAVQKYQWNRWISDKVSYGPATLSNLKLGSTKKPVVIAKPGEIFEGEVVCSFNKKECAALSLYRVVLGIKNLGGQTTVFNHFGLRAGKETDHFALTAPKHKGVYQVAFRVIEAAREGTAIKSWDELEHSSAATAPVIGLIVVV